MRPNQCTKMEGMNLSASAVSDLKDLLSDKASDLFSICDQEEKGFVTKRDMQRMRSELPLEPEQLEAVFDILDGDHNGYLTLEEFTEGFAVFLGIDKPDLDPGTEPDSNTKEKEESEPKLNNSEYDEMDEEEEFNNLLSDLGVLGLVEDDAALRAMWMDLRRSNDPTLMSNFEGFLAKLSKDMQKQTTEQEKFENSIKTRTTEQEERLQKLYEEMEHQARD